MVHPGRANGAEPRRRHSGRDPQGIGYAEDQLVARAMSSTQSSVRLVSRPDRLRIRETSPTSGK
jgi:hypothetical protein